MLPRTLSVVCGAIDFGLGGEHGDHDALIARFRRTLFRYIAIFNDMPNEAAWGNLLGLQASCCGMLEHERLIGTGGTLEPSCCGMFDDGRPVAAGSLLEPSCCGMFESGQAAAKGAVLEPSCCGMFENGRHQFSTATGLVSP